MGEESHIKLDEYKLEVNKLRDVLAHIRRSL